MLETLKFHEINDTSHFIGAEHPIHCCFQELDSDGSSNFSPDVVSTEGVQVLQFYRYLPIAEGRYQYETPQEASGRNFIPQRDVTRYCNATRGYSCNGTTECQALCWPISYHSVRAWFCCQLRLRLKVALDYEHRAPTHLSELW